MALYRISDLMEISGTTERATRQLFKSNEELRKLKVEHTIKKQNKVYYDDTILNWFVAYYNFKNRPLVSNDMPPQENRTESEKNPEHSPAISDEVKQMAAEIEELKRKNQALQADFEKANGEIVDLKNEIASKSNEIAQLLLIIQQEKQEKSKIMLMLPPPRRSIGERIKSLFGGKKD